MFSAKRCFFVLLSVLRKRDLVFLCVFEIETATRL